LDVQEDECGADDGDEHGENEEQPAAIHGRFTFRSDICRPAGGGLAVRVRGNRIEGLEPSGDAELASQMVGVSRRRPWRFGKESIREDEAARS
jgi:hypothetical protein